MTETHAVIAAFSAALNNSSDLKRLLPGGMWYTHIPDDVRYPVLRFWLVTATPTDLWAGQLGEGIIAVDIYSETLGGNSEICSIIDLLVHRRQLSYSGYTIWARRDEGWRHEHEPDERGGRGLWTTSAHYTYEVVAA